MIYLLLNNECLDMIFSFLNVVDLIRVSSVCKTWFVLCEHKISSMKIIDCKALQQALIKTRKGFRSLKSKHLVTIIRRNSGCLLNLNLGGVVLLGREILDAVAEHCPNLVSLNMENSGYEYKIDDLLESTYGMRQDDVNLVRELLIRTNVKDITLSDVVNEKDLGWILKHAKSLEQLSLKYSAVVECKINGTAIVKYLSFNNMTKIDILAIKNLSGSVFVCIVSNFRHCLTELCVNGGGGILLSDIDFRTLAYCRMAKLTKIVASELMTEKCVKSNVSKTWNQTKLFLGLFPKLKLLTVTLSDILDVFVSIIAYECPLLEVIAFSFCNVDYTEVFSSLSSLKYITDLTIDWPGRSSLIGPPYKGLYPAVFLAEVATKFTSLRILSLRTVMGFDIYDLMAVAELIECNEKLEILNFERIWCTDDEKELFFNRCKSIKRTLKLIIYFRVSENNCCFENNVNKPSFMTVKKLAKRK